MTSIISTICDKWNKIYSKDCYKASLIDSVLPVLETDKNARFKKLIIKEIRETVVFPVLSVSCETRLDSMKEKCDAIALYENSDGTYSLLLIEMKSGFDTQKLFYARTQIQQSAVKIMSLLSSIKEYRKLQISPYGIIVSLAPNSDREDYLSKISMLPPEEQGNERFALNLYANSGRDAVVINEDNGSIEQESLPFPFPFRYYASEGEELVINLPVK